MYSLVVSMNCPSFSFSKCEFFQGGFWLMIRSFWRSSSLTSRKETGKKKIPCFLYTSLLVGSSVTTSRPIVDHWSIEIKPKLSIPSKKFLDSLASDSYLCQYSRRPVSSQNKEGWRYKKPLVIKILSPAITWIHIFPIGWKDF